MRAKRSTYLRNRVGPDWRRCRGPELNRVEVRHEALFPSTTNRSATAEDLSTGWSHIRQRPGAWVLIVPHMFMADRSYIAGGVSGHPGGCHWRTGTVRCLGGNRQWTSPCFADETRTNVTDIARHR
jgi:hypothetical protein